MPAARAAPRLQPRSRVEAQRPSCRRARRQPAAGHRCCTAALQLDGCRGAEAGARRAARRHVAAAQAGLARRRRGPRASTATSGTTVRSRTCAGCYCRRALQRPAVRLSARRRGRAGTRDARHVQSSAHEVDARRCSAASGIGAAARDRAGDRRGAAGRRRRARRAAPGDRVVAADGHAGRRTGRHCVQRDPRSSRARPLAHRGASAHGQRRCSCTVDARRGGRRGERSRPDRRRAAGRRARRPQLMTACATARSRRCGRAPCKTWDMSVFTLRMLGRMVIGEVSWKNLSRAADHRRLRRPVGAASAGSPYLGFLALVSVSLGRAQPAADPAAGWGHLMYYVVESRHGRPVSERIMEIGCSAAAWRCCC